MANVAINKVTEKKTAENSFIDEVKSLTARIRERAFHLFERRPVDAGSELEDWLTAERDLLFVPDSLFVEREGKFELTLKVPGFEASEIEVTALPDALIVKAASTGKDSERTMLSRFDLPEAIDADHVTANLEKDVLTLVAPKTAGKAIPIAA